MAGSIDFVYFDLGNVLLAFDHARAARQMAAVAGCSVDVVEAVVFCPDGLQIRYERGDMDDAGFVAAFAKATGTRPEQEALLTAASDIFWPLPETHAIVWALAAAGARIGILSNTCAAHWRFCEARFPELLDTFPVTALSYELNSMKPDAAIYRAAEKLAGVRGESIFFVDDRADNVAGAAALGWTTSVFTSAEALRADLRRLGLPV